jgi:hypothetical protein
MPYFNDKKIFDSENELWNSDTLIEKISEAPETQHELSHREIINELLAVQEITIANIDALVAAGTVSTTGILASIETLQTTTTGLQSAIDDLNDDFDAQKVDVIALQTLTGTYTRQIADHEARITALETP